MLITDSPRAEFEWLGSIPRSNRATGLESSPRWVSGGPTGEPLAEAASTGMQEPDQAGQAEIEGRDRPASRRDAP